MNKLYSRDRDNKQRTAESIKSYQDRMMSSSTLKKKSPKKFDLNLNLVEQHNMRV